MKKNYINIAVRLDTHKKLTFFKVQHKEKNLDNIIRRALELFGKRNHTPKGEVSELEAKI